jgi:hypothetical protein
MRSPLFSHRSVGCLAISLGVAVLLLTVPSVSRANTDARGTVGLVLRQIYDEQKPDHRGPLAVMHVIEDSTAAKAGIHCSDFIVAVNGVPTPGRSFSDILTQDFRGPVGGTVRVTVVRFDGSQSEITLVRAPYPPHNNPASDPFAYTVPGSWAADSRYPFPLPWSPDLAYRGFEDLFFAPNFDQTDSPEYHSYLFFLWLEGTHLLGPKQLEADMVTYFRGLAEERGRNYGFTPDLSKIAASYREDPGTSQTLGGASAKALSGTVTIWDTHGKLITLNSEVLISTCGTADHTAFFFGMSMEPRDGGTRDGSIWKEIDAIRDTFRCQR